MRSKHLGRGRERDQESPSFLSLLTLGYEPRIGGGVQQTSQRLGTGIGGLEEQEGGRRGFQTRARGRRPSPQFPRGGAWRGFELVMRASQIWDLALH